MKKIILIPTRINSKRLPAKALLEIEKIPIIIHTYKRASLSKLADDVFVCTDSLEIIKTCKKFSTKYIKTSSKHNNGTERIAEAAKKLKLKKNDLIIDVQGDEPLINPKDIDKTIFFFMKNKFDIVVPNIKLKLKNNPNIVKLIINHKKRILWMSRNDIPYGFNEQVKYFNKHLSIIVFNSKSLIEYSKLKKSKFEKIESIELLRALENAMLMGSNNINSSSFSVDVIEDYHKAKKYFKSDKIKNKYLM
jgi:3-deoxy-manno-octulosonate cytidylyltransferase (CMP-KDO synthetase)|tara:strand:+ start:111 stop:857 length:747 start_codon:yes stop_codon:yes gene_type:complete